MGLRLMFLPNFPEATFIQGGMFIPDSRVSAWLNLIWMTPWYFLKLAA